MLLGAVLPAAVSAQVVAPGESGVSMGHFHLNTQDSATQQKFWNEIAGAQDAKMGPMQVSKLPGVLVLFTKAEPKGGTEGSVVDHIGFRVTGLKSILSKAEAAHIQILKHDDKSAMLLAPDGIRVALIEDSAMTQPVAIGFSSDHPEDMKKWYAATFGATIPGVSLHFASAATAPAGTKGRALDHIGFEVKNLEEFANKLAASGVKFNVPYRKIPSLGIAIAFFTDPWGTYIELTEGLDKI